MPMLGTRVALPRLLVLLSVGLRRRPPSRESQWAVSAALPEVRLDAPEDHVAGPRGPDVRNELRPLHHVGEGEDDDARRHADFALTAHVRPDTIAQCLLVDGRGGERFDDDSTQVARVVVLGDGTRGRAGG